MVRPHALIAFVALAAAAGCERGGGPSFGVQSDFEAPLEAEPGADVRVRADSPFRLRLEVEQLASGGRPVRYCLQYRRNEGAWQDLEAHDFPYPLRELELSFAEGGGRIDDWRVATGDSTGVAVEEDDGDPFLRVRAAEEPVIGLYTPPWELDAFSLVAGWRLVAASAGGVGLAFGYVDSRNHWRLVAKAPEGVLQVTRIVDGKENVVAEHAARIVADEWRSMEVQLENGTLEITFGDDELEFDVPVGSEVPQSDLGFFVPAGGLADFREFVIEGEPSSPRASIVSAKTYAHGAATGDLIEGSAAPFVPGAAVSLARCTPPLVLEGAHTELEWPLVIRKFADDAEMNEDGDRFEFRVVDEDGEPTPTSATAVLTLDVPAGHLGGTFVEAPGRIGPWQAQNGDLYFVMEPAESDNLFMMVKSSDGGKTWREVDGANRPATGDLESVDGRQDGATIHLIHQVSESTRYHAFRTSDHPAAPDTWAVTDELGTEVTARAQQVTLALRPDGSLVTFHLGDTVGYAVRSPSGEWSDEVVVDDSAAGTTHLAGPQAVPGAGGVVHVAYYRSDGSIWYRRLEPGGTLTPAVELATGAGTSEDDFGAVLPLVYLPETGTVVVLYRLADGRLWERRITGDGSVTSAVAVTDRPVVQSAVDSQQVGADAVADGDTVHVLFIDDAARSIYSTRYDGRWLPSTLEIGGIDAAWVRGNVYLRPDGTKVYGYVYDAGSEGGAGMNRYAEIVTGGRTD